MKKYSLLYFQQINDNNSKWIFPLHNGENIIGSDKDVDIFLYLNNKEDFIDLVHAKIILEESKNIVSIINLSSKGTIKKLENKIKISLTPLKEYELSDKTEIFLSENSKFILIKGTLEEIKQYLSKENLENEYQKWYQRIMDKENNLKINLSLNLNLSRKDSSFCGKSFLSNTGINNNENNIINKNSGIFNQNTFPNRDGFNNFDEVPDFLAFSNISKKSISSKFNSQINNKNQNSNIIPFNLKNDEYYYNENKKLINTAEKKNNNNEKMDINKNDSENKGKGLLDNSIDNLENIFKFENINENQKNNQEVIKDENTNKIIKQLLGETNLETINRNTNNNLVIEYDNYFHNLNNNRNNRRYINLSNIDIQLKQNNIEDKIKKVKKKIYGKK